MSYSDGFKVNVNKLNADESLLILLSISHPFIAEPIRLVNDSKDFVFQGNSYIQMPLSFKRQNDIQGELPRVSIEIPNVGRSLVKWVDSSGGGKNAIVSVILARRSADVIEEKIDFSVSSVSVKTETISFMLDIQNNLIKRAIRWVYDRDHARGLF